MIQLNPFVTSGMTHTTSIDHCQNYITHALVIKTKILFFQINKINKY